jgi:hypothetical protein
MLALAPVRRDGPAPVRGHAPGRLLGDVQAAESADRDRPFDSRRIDLRDRAACPGTGVVDDDVGLAEPSVGALEQPNHSRRVGRIRRKREGTRFGFAGQDAPPRGDQAAVARP